MAESEQDEYEGYPEIKGWSEWGGTGDELAGYYEKEVAPLLRTGSSVLEIGFGGGDLLIWLKARGCRVAGIEVQPDLVSRALANGFAAHLGTMEKLSGGLGSDFDVVIAIDVLEHIDRPSVAHFLCGVAACLKQGGLLLLRFPNGQSPFGRIYQYGDATHKSVLSLSALQREIAEAGLVVRSYGQPAEDPGRGLGQRVWRAVRRAMRKTLYMVLALCFDREVPWSPNVVLVLEKRGSSGGGC